METIVRKILNYDTNCNNHQRDEMVANIVALALKMLDDKKKFNFPDDCARVAYKNIPIVAGETDENLEIHYRRKVLKEFENLFDDIMIIGHEVCHVAQNYLKDNPNYRNVDLYYSQDGKFAPLLQKIIEICYPEYMPMLDSKGLIKTIKKFEDLEAYYDYFESFYYLQESEFEAYNFQMEFLKKIYEIAEKMDLNTYEQEKLRLYKRCSKPDIDTMGIILDRSKKARTSSAVTSKIKNCCNQVIADVINRFPNFFEDVSTMKRKELDDIYDDIYNIISSLEISYNNDIGQSLFNALMKSKLAYQYKVELLNELYGFTPIQLDENQTQFLKDLMAKYNENYKCKMKFDVLTEDKKRIARENKIFSPTTM